MSVCKITTLVKNLEYKKGLSGGHGFSLLIEREKEKILFDTGQTTHFLKNAHTLGIDLYSVSQRVISHGHYDHTSGLSDFLNINSIAPLWLNSLGLKPKYDNKNEYTVSPE